MQMFYNIDQKLKEKRSFLLDYAWTPKLHLSFCVLFEALCCLVKKWFMKESEGWLSEL